jgi:Ca-activated chloride channel family protein
MSRFPSDRRATLVLLAALALLLLPALACGSVPQLSRSAAIPEDFYTEGAMAEEPVAVATQAPAQPGPTPDAMFFENYGVNPFIDTEDDNLSTFAMDVDTGSYTIARGYIEDGLLPPKDAVRVEEFVNYFDYDYPLPDEERTFAVHLDGAPSPFGETERYEMVRIGIQGYQIPAEERKDVVLTFVIDVSGSMDREDRLTLVKRALTLLVEELRPTDSVAIVVYGNDARAVLPPTPASDKNTILDAIYGLQPEGATNAEGGLLLGYRQAEAAFNAEANNRVILASDGVANIGETGPESILDTIEEYAQRDIYLTTVGFGMGNYNDVLMEQLANQGDGFYAYVDSINEARRLFVNNLTGTLETIAKDAKVQVDFNPEVVARYRLLGFENRAIADEQFRDDTVDAGEIGAGHSVTALYEIKRHPEAEGRLATVYLRWEDPDSGEVSEISADLESTDLVDTFADAEPGFQLAVVVSEFAEVLRESYWAQESSLAGVLNEAERIGSLFEQNQDVAGLVELVESSAQVPKE